MSDKCTIPQPKGYVCTRGKHDPLEPCAVVKQPWYKKLTNAVGEALGQTLFGGQR